MSLPRRGAGVNGVAPPAHRRPLAKAAGRRWRPVLALLGEGSALYGIQGLWTAAHFQVPVTFVVCNNAEYQILKDCAGLMPLPRMAAGRFLAMDLVQPEIDFVGLARSLGVQAQRVTEPEELSERLHASLAGDKPVLLDVPLVRQKAGA